MKSYHIYFMLSKEGKMKNAIWKLCIIRAVDSNYPLYFSACRSPEQPLETIHLRSWLKICQASDQLPRLQISGEEWVAKRRLCVSESVPSLWKRPTLLSSERAFPITHVAAKKTAKNANRSPGRSCWGHWSPAWKLLSFGNSVLSVHSGTTRY